MSEEHSSSHLSIAPYRPADDAYDELGRGALPHHWVDILQHFASSEDRGDPESQRRDMLIRHVDAERPWRLDPIPFVLSADDWQHIERGLIQRAELLNAIVGDLYGTRRLLSPGGVPPALVFSNPRFLLPTYDYRAPDQEFLQVLAFDLGRSPDGQWRVLADWTEAPHGLGVSLENRIATSQAYPDLFARYSVVRLANFFGALANHIQNVGARTRADGITVMLSGGPAETGYFEHTYLGQYFGFPVAEGADFTVRHNGISLKTLEGLKPVAAIYRQLPAAECDSLELDPDSLHGIAGLTEIARNGGCLVANALGTGVVENRALMSFLPSLAETLLGEPLRLPGLASWWCGQREAAAHVAANVGNLNVTSAFTRYEPYAESIQNLQEVQEGNSTTAGMLDPEALHYTVARETIRLSNSPYLGDDGSLHAAPTVLRLFVAATDQGYRLMPGGIARVAAPHGELSKDVWVADGALSEIKTTAASGMRDRRSDRDLPSHTADDLFWLGRYLERCEGAARAYRNLFTHVGGLEEQRQTAATVMNLLVSLDMLASNRANHFLQGDEPGERAWWSILFDAESTDGLPNILANVHRVALNVRERLSGDAWQMVLKLAEAPRQTWSISNLTSAIELMDDIIMHVSALHGQTQENMTRGYGWRVLDIGRRIERANYGTQILREVVTSETFSASQMYLLLDLSDSMITYRSRYKNLPVLENLLYLLLLDETNPRSVVYQVQRLEEHMSFMPLEQTGDELSDSRRMLLGAYHELTLAEPEKLASVVSKAGNRTQLKRVLTRLDKTMSKLSELITATYFAHARKTQ